MIRAQAKGVIDFARADPRDRLWWQRLPLLLDQLEDDADRALLEAGLQLRAALLGLPGLEQSSREQLHNQWRESYEALLKLLKPWHSAESAVPVAALSAWYKQVIGDPADPAVLARIAEGIARDKAARAETQRKAAQEQATLRRIQEERAARSRPARPAAGRNRPRAR